MSKLNLKIPNRCDWVPLTKPIYLEYHDNEWGKPIKDDHKLFELMILEMFQAGLNWYIILKKRKAFKIAFDNFNPKKVAVYNQKKINQLLNNSMIIRNRLKIKSSINNANKFLEIQNKFDSFSNYIWNFTDNFPIINKWENSLEIPCESKLSTSVSKDLKKRGFQFFGPTITYSFMQAAGLINDHTINCEFK
tara:strand:- start:3048 stop:3623 length:576 start_codon:yes stop_codon:yes gene_type:complete